MDIKGEQRIHATQEKVWEALNNPDILCLCLPGCESLEETDSNSFEAIIVTKIGPVKAKFKGAVTLSEIDSPNSYVLTGEGKGGPAGFIKGGAKVVLKSEGKSTILTYDATAKVGGKIAQVGSRLVDMAARKMAEDFFAKFCDVVGEPEEVSVKSGKTSSSHNIGLFGMPLYAWIASAAVVASLVYIFAK